MTDRLSLCILLEEIVAHTVFYIADAGVQVHVSCALKNIHINIRIRPAEFFNQPFHFLPFGKFLILPFVALLCETASTLQKMQPVIVLPGQDVRFLYQIQGTDQFHPFKIRAPKLRHHRIDLCAVKHAHENRPDHIVKMMAQGKVIAPKLSCVGKEITPTEP